MKKILIINCGSKKTPLIAEHVKALTEFEILNFTNVRSIKKYSGIIISGAPILLTETSHGEYLNMGKIIFSNKNLPVLGICFGHQLMGIYHHALISKCDEDRNTQSILVVKKNDLFGNKNESYNFMEDHCESITCPESFTTLAYSVICENEMMQHNTNPWYGVQFHPEVSGDNGKQLIHNFIRLCK